jgi:hypothetical protein
MTLAHIAGIPVEESVAYIAMSCTGAVVAIRVWFGRWLPRRSPRSDPSIGANRKLVE